MMKKLLTIIAMVTIAVASDKSTVKLDDEIFKPNAVIYTAENEIVDVHMSMLDEQKIFIVEANLPKREYKGLYALNVKDDDNIIRKKVLDKGKCITSDNTTVFFGASDGIYTYNIAKNKAEKYGNITIDVKAIQKDTNKDLIYVITEHKLKKITNMGTKIEEVESVNDVQEIVMDNKNNVYFFEKRDASTTAFKETYTKLKVIAADKIIEAKGLPDNYSQMKLVRGGSLEGALVILDKRIYRLFPNGTSIPTEFIFENEPTAYYFDLGVIMLFGRGQKLYAFTILSVLLEGVSNAISQFFSGL